MRTSRAYEDSPLVCVPLDRSKIQHFRTATLANITFDSNELIECLNELIQ